MVGSLGEEKLCWLSKRIRVDFPSILTSRSPTHGLFAVHVPWLHHLHLLSSPTLHVSPFPPSCLKHTDMPSHSHPQQKSTTFYDLLSPFANPHSLFSPLEKIFKCYRCNFSLLKPASIRGHARPSYATVPSCYPNINN